MSDWKLRVVEGIGNIPTIWINSFKIWNNDKDPHMAGYLERGDDIAFLFMTTKKLSYQELRELDNLLQEMVKLVE